MKIWEEPLEFDWDEGNIGKNLKHNVKDKEAEEVFDNNPKFSLEDEKHSLSEKRYMLWGINNKGRRLSIFFTIRTGKVRIISARDMHKKKGRNMKKEFKKIPKFKNEDEERDFWATADSSEYFDWSKAERVIFPNLKPSTKSISIRLPEYLIARIKELANSMDVPYQSLIKIFLAERVERELRSK